MDSRDAPLEPLGFDDAAAAAFDTAQLLSDIVTIPPGARAALIQAETQNVRWTDDGSAPTASRGMRLFKDSSVSYAGKLRAIKVISETAGAKLNVSFYR